MPVPKRSSYTPIRAPRGGRTHLTSMHAPGKTACGRSCNSWIVVGVAVEPDSMAGKKGCQRCKAAVFLRVGRR